MRLRVSAVEVVVAECRARGAVGRVREEGVISVVYDVPWCVLVGRDGADADSDVDGGRAWQGQGDGGGSTDGEQAEGDGAHELEDGNCEWSHRDQQRVL